MPPVFELAGERFKFRARQHPLEHSAKSSAQPYLDLGNTKQVRRSLAHPLQVHVVHAHNLAAMNIDDLAIHQVLLQVEIIALILQRNQRA